MTDNGTTHNFMNQRVKDVTFCEEEEGRWNTRLHYALEDFEFIGDIVRCSEDEFGTRTQLGRETRFRLDAFLSKYGLSIGMADEIISRWKRPTTKWN